MIKEEPKLLFPENEKREALQVLKKVNGVEDAKIVLERYRTKINAIELSAEDYLSTVVAGWRNDGIRDVLKRNTIVAILHNLQLRHPPGPTVTLVQESDILGEETWDDEKKFSSVDQRDDISIGDSFIIHRNKSIQSRKKPIFVFPSLRFPELEAVKQFRNVSAGSPSQLGDLFIKEIMDWAKNDITLGTVLVGFD